MSDKTSVSTQLSLLLSETDSKKSVEKPTNFVVRGSILEWEHDITPESRWDVYNSLWNRGTLPTRDDLRYLPPPANWGMGRFWAAFVEEATCHSFYEDYVEDKSCDEDECNCALYKDLLAGGPDLVPEEPETLLDSLTDQHFADLAQYMKDWADSDDFDGGESDYFEIYASSQDYAFWFFNEGFGADWREDVGVLVVDGYSPGHDAQAAELTVSIEEANRRAIELGIPVRFREKVDQPKQKEEPVQTDVKPLYDSKSREGWKEI
jgi:hypothetical protein